MHKNGRCVLATEIGTKRRQPSRPESGTPAEIPLMKRTLADSTQSANAPEPPASPGMAFAFSSPGNTGTRYEESFVKGRDPRRMTLVLPGAEKHRPRDEGDTERRVGMESVPRIRPTRKHLEALEGIWRVGSEMVRLQGERGSGVLVALNTRGEAVNPMRVISGGVKIGV